MDRSEATELVLRELNEQYGRDGDEIVLLEDGVLEKTYGWVFFYQSRRFLETNDLMNSLIGNGPIVVLREGGSRHELPTAAPWEDELAAFEARRRFKQSFEDP